MTDDGSPPSVRQPGTRLTPARVRAMQFPRAAVGRRGYSAEAVDQFIRRMAEEVTGRDAAEADLRAQLDRVRNALRQWQTRQLEKREPGAPVTHPGEGRNVDAVNTLSQAQQQADAYIAQAREYCRQITSDARNRADAILCEAQERAEATTAQARRTYDAIQASMPAPERASGGGRPDEPGLDELDRRLSWARSFVAALQTVETQLSTSRLALAHELEALDRLTAARSRGGGLEPARPAPSPSA